MIHHPFFASLNKFRTGFVGSQAFDKIHTKCKYLLHLLIHYTYINWNIWIELHHITSAFEKTQEMQKQMYNYLPSTKSLRPDLSAIQVAMFGFALHSPSTQRCEHARPTGMRLAHQGDILGQAGRSGPSMGCGTKACSTIHQSETSALQSIIYRQIVWKWYHFSYCTV